MGMLPQALVIQFDAFSSTTRTLDLGSKRNQSVDAKNNTPIRELPEPIPPDKEPPGRQSSDESATV